MLALSPQEGSIKAPWAPAADVHRIAEGWLLKFELAGVRRDDVRVSLDDNSLTVEGVRRDWSVEEDPECHSMEISYSHFSRSIELPDGVQGAQIAVEYTDGMLVVRLQAGESQ